MANHKSAKKRIRSSKKRAQINKRVLTTLRKCEKKLKIDLDNKDTKTIEEGLKKLFTLTDRAKKKGIIKKNTASRKKSRMSLKALNQKS